MTIYSHYAISALESNISDEITLECVSILGRFQIKLRWVIVLILGQRRESGNARFLRNEMRARSKTKFQFRKVKTHVRTELEMQIRTAPKEGRCRGGRGGFA